MSGRNFRFYISSALVLLALLVSITVTTVLLLTLKAGLEAEIADRLLTTARLGVKTLDLAAYERLTSLLADRDLSASEIEAIEATEDFRSISTSLNELRDLKPDLFHFVYTLYPTSDPQRAKFVVDADVLALRRQFREQGTMASQPTPFNMDYLLKDQPVTVTALQTRQGAVESTFVYDYSENVWSMMGFAPIFSSSGSFLGVLGIDASNDKVAGYLAQLFYVAVLLTAALVALILAFALWMAHRLSRPILELTGSVRRLSDQEWGTRVSAQSKIREIYDLKMTFNNMADRIEAYQDSLKKTNESLLRFVPLEILQFLERKDITEVELGDQTQKDMAVLVLDVRHFSALTETKSPKQIFAFVNSYLSRLAPIVRRHRGFVDQYLEDGLMALFPGDCDDAVAAALELQRELAALNLERDAERLPPIEAGIGLHAGVLMLGTIGEHGRVQGTVISDAVNVATRLEAQTLHYGVSTLMSKDFYDRLKHPEALDCRFVGWGILQGRVEAVPLLELYGADAADQKVRKTRSKPEFERGVRLLQEGQKGAARVVFETILRDNPLDKPARRLAEESQIR